MAKNETDEHAYESMRAELLGIEFNREEFEKQQLRILQNQNIVEEEEIAYAKNLDAQDGVLKTTSGKLDELNTVLSSTQKRINRFKQNACKSLSSLFGKVSIDQSDLPSTYKESNDIKEVQSCEKFSDLHTKQADGEPKIPTEKNRNAQFDIENKMTSHLSRIDILIKKSENAELSMSDQIRQMKKIAK